MRHLIVFGLLFFASWSASAQCSITEMTAIASDCNFNGQFFVTVDFDHMNTSEKFTVLGNGKNYGNFNYSALPVKLGPFNGDCQTQYEFVARDLVTSTCSDFVDLGKVCCENKCKVHFAQFSADSCDGQLYHFEFNLEKNVGPDSKKFKVFTNGQVVGEYAYTDLPVKIKNMPTSPIETYNEIVVCDGLNLGCCDTIEIINPCICLIYNIRSQVVDCNEENEQFDIRFSFDHQMTSDSFLVGGNGLTYGKFAYSQLPIKLDNIAFSGDNIEFLFVDINDGLCFASYDLGKVDECDFECEIEKVKVDVGECQNDSIVFYLKLDYANTSLEGFKVRGSGIDYGLFEYQESGAEYRLGPIKPDCSKEYEFVVIDQMNEACRKAVVLEEDACCSCELEELIVTEQCDGNKLVAFDVNFSYENPSDEFRLFIGSQNLGNFKYADLPIKVTNLSGLTTNVVIKVVDVKNEACRLLAEHTFVCAIGESCKITNLQVKASACNDNDQFFALIKFNIQGVSTAGFQVLVNGQPKDTFAYGQTLYEVGPLAGDCITKYKFIVKDLAKPDCIADIALSEPVCCDNNKCKLSSPTISLAPCIDGKFDVNLNFLHEFASPKFRLKINGQALGPYEYANLPLKLEKLMSNTPYEILILDVEDELCNVKLTIPAIACPSSTIDIIEPKIVYAGDRLIVTCDPGLSTVKAHIRDIQGRLLSETYFTASTEISMDSWRSGVYILTLSSGKYIYHAKVSKF
jgi:hypothetical protein